MIKKVVQNIFLFSVQNILTLSIVLYKNNNLITVLTASRSYIRGMYSIIHENLKEDHRKFAYPFNFNVNGIGKKMNAYNEKQRERYRQNSKKQS
jgi:hypothetical protein